MPSSGRQMQLTITVSTSDAFQLTGPTGWQWHAEQHGGGCAHLLAIEGGRPSNGGLLGSRLLEVHKGEGVLVLLLPQAHGRGAAQRPKHPKHLRQLLGRHALGQVAHEDAGAGRALIPGKVPGSRQM